MPETGIKKNLALHDIAPSDIEELARFIGPVSGTDVPLDRAVARLSWILLENPARQPGDPLGWLLRSASGDLVGCMCCAPQKFCLGETSFTLIMANSFYVDDAYRGGGTSIFLKYLQLGRRYPLFVSSANAAVSEMWRKVGAYPLANSGHEVLGIVRWPPLVAESVYRKTASRRMAQYVATLASVLLRPRRLLAGTVAGQLTALHSSAEAASICAEHRSDKITNCRDGSFLKWRYFSRADPGARLFAFRPGGGAEQKPFMVAVRLQNRGYKQQIRALQILDVWGEAEPESYLAIAACLQREYHEQIDVLVFRCLNPAAEALLITHGFKVRPFAAPIAWCMDKFKLLPSNSWYLVPADGDMFL